MERSFSVLRNPYRSLRHGNDAAEAIFLNISEKFEMELNY